jgi:signal transduction histidine kinase
MRFRNDPAPDRTRWPWWLPRPHLPGRLRGPLSGGPDRQVPSWRHTAREASDMRSLGQALTRLAEAPADVVAGPEPAPLPAGGGRFGWLRHYRPLVLWLSAAATFALSIQLLVENSRLWALLVPPVAACIALPLVLAVDTPLRAWRVQVVVAAVVPLAVSPPSGWTSAQGPPWPPTLVFVGLYVLLTVAARLELHLLLGVWILTDVVIFLGYVVVAGPRRSSLGEANVAILMVTILIAYGYLFGTRRRLQRELVEGRQREQAQQARSSLLEERARIARELHDVVAHHMSVIAVRAETAPFRIPGLPEAVKDDMAETSAIAREALTEMRRLLGVLRGADSGAERAPQPGMARLEGLVTAVRGAGLAVDLLIDGDQRPLPSGVELSAYRILQEALSNTLRHAPGAKVTVEVRYEPDRLCLRVRNDAPAGRDRPQPTVPGHGIVGMRERAAMLGGTLAAGPAPDGGYLVEAVLPLDADRDHTAPS